MASMPTRSTLETTVRAYADTAVTIVRKSLPKALPKVELPAMLQATPATKTSRGKRAVKARTAKTVKRAKRAVKSAKR